MAKWTSQLGHVVSGTYLRRASLFAVIVENVCNAARINALNVVKTG